MRKAIPLASALLVLAGVPVAGASEGSGASRSGDSIEATQQIVLQVSLLDTEEELEVTALPGQTIRIHNRESDLVFELIPSFDAAADLRVAVQTQEVLQIGDSEVRSLVNAVPVVAGDAVEVFDSQVAVRLVGFENAPMISTASTGPQDLRPFNCCITCNGITACSHCVAMSCGRCCTH